MRSTRICKVPLAPLIELLREIARVDFDQQYVTYESGRDERGSYVSIRFLCGTADAYYTPNQACELFGTAIGVCFALQLQRAACRSDSRLCGLVLDENEIAVIYAGLMSERAVRLAKAVPPPLDWRPAYVIAEDRMA